MEVSSNDDKFLIGTFYRPPNSDGNVWNLIEQSIELTIDTRFSNILITGDFNENQLINYNSKIKDILRLYNLHQLICDPTSISENSETLIDLLITNKLQNVVYYNVFEPFLDVNVRYHKPIIALLKSTKPKNTTIKRKIWLYNQGNYDLYRQKLSEVNWDDLLNENDSVNIIADKTTDKMLEIGSLTIPNRIITVRQNELPWIINDIRRLMRKRDRIRRKLKSNNTAYNISKYKKIRNQVVNLLRNAKRKYHNDLCNKIKSNQFASKDWWKLIKQLSNKSRNNNNIQILLSETGTTVTDNTEKANLLNRFFALQSTIDDSNASLPTANDDIPAQDVIDSIDITPEDVKDILKTLNTNKAIGDDLVSPRLLKEGCHELSVPLSKLFNLSLKTKTFPSKWKISNVVPIYKKSDPKKPENYRPISLLSVTSKVLEKCVYKYIHNFIVRNKLLSQHQSGFTRRDSTINQLLFITNEISKALDDGLEVRVVFFDISKAFDRVWHKGLLYKIEKLGIMGDWLNWIKSYLLDRKQKVINNGKESISLNINAGVPQGSILGPLFFLIFINDIVQEIGCSIKLFADDTSIYIIVEDPNTGAQILNDNLNKVHTWSENWLVSFNPQKTESILISRKHNHINHPILSFNHVPVKEVTSHKHLGIILNTMCQWGNQIDQLINKVTPKLNVLRSLKFDLDRKTLEIMYFSFVRPIMEYGDIIFDNCPLYYKERIEKINVEAARIVTGATKLVSLQLLYKECGWDTLEKRREHHKLIQFYKMINGLTPEYLSNLIPQQHNQMHRYNTRQSDNIINIQCKTTHHYQSFLPSAIRLWNALPIHVRESNSIQSFKNALSTLSNKRIIPKHYYTGDRRGQILHARLRMKCSSLKQHLYAKNIEPDPYCLCGHIESTTHFLLKCERFAAHRRILLQNLGPNIPITTELLIDGDPNMSFEYNKNIFIHVQTFILNTKRFT